MPQLAEYAERHHRRAVNLSRQAIQLEHGAAEPAELLFQRLGRQRMLHGLGERFVADQVAGPAGGRPADRAQRLAHARLDMHVQSDAPLRVAAPKSLPQPFRQLRVVRLPDLLSRIQPSQVDVVASESQFNQASLALA